VPGLSNKEPKAERRGTRASGRTRRLKQSKPDAKAQSKTAQSDPIANLATSSVLFPGEDRAGYAELHKEMKKIFQPDMPPHVEVVVRATALIWRLRRIPAFEAAIFSATAKSLGYAPEALAQSANFGAVLDAMLKTDAFSKISQYEASLREQFKLAKGELQMLMDWNIKNGLHRSSIDYVEAVLPDDPDWLK
jgi:hypothetical protein